jgi:hypothetical protein
VELVRVLVVVELEVIELLVTDLHHYKDVQLLYVLLQIIQLQSELEVETLAVQLILHPLHLTQMVLVLVMEWYHLLKTDVQ